MPAAGSADTKGRVYGMWMPRPNPASLHPPHDDDNGGDAAARYRE